jgi:dihydropteroate synthase
MSLLKIPCGNRILDLSTPQVMGILNVTPDSFSDGGQFFNTGRKLDIDAVVLKAEQMYNEGARILDIGGESTRPNAAFVSDHEEMDRVLPVLEALLDIPVILSIDTSSPVVMKEAIKLGAHMINDTRALSKEGAVDIVADSDVAVCLMHMQGSPVTMQNNPSYQSSVVDEVCSFLEERVHCCHQAGIAHERIIIDPGFGFGKTLDHNIHLLKNLNRLTEGDSPVLVGLSNKSMLGTLTGKPVEERVYSSVAGAVIAVLNGAKILRVHDVNATIDALKVCESIV